MPAINFQEIPPANVADGKQDTFELFARDFLEMFGFKIEEGPDRGQDGGRDLIVVEERNGITGKTKIKWLVSCKHKAHSGTSVNDRDEVDLSDRIRTHNAQGFIGFYSTVISSPLGRKLKALEEKFEILIFDNERIEKKLLENENMAGEIIAKRYFPESYKKWKPEDPSLRPHIMERYEPSNVLQKYQPLKCCCCGKDLLNSNLISKWSGIVVFVETYDENNEIDHIYDIYWACKGKCDRELERSYPKNTITKWEDISDIIIPINYLRWNLAILNRIRDKDDEYADIAFDKLKTFIITISQFVLRSQNDEQVERFNELLSIPNI